MNRDIGTAHTIKTLIGLTQSCYSCLCIALQGKRVYKTVKNRETSAINMVKLHRKINGANDNIATTSKLEHSVQKI